MKYEIKFIKPVKTNLEKRYFGKKDMYIFQNAKHLVTHRNRKLVL